MSDEPVRTRISAQGRWWSFQEFMIKGRGEGPVEDVDFRGAATRQPTPEVLAAIAEAQAIVIGPSNPVDLDRPDPGAAGNQGGAASRRPGRRGQPARRGRGGQGADRRVHALGGPPAEQRRHRGVRTTA